MNIICAGDMFQSIQPAAGATSPKVGLSHPVSDTYVLHQSFHELILAQQVAHQLQIFTRNHGQCNLGIFMCLTIEQEVVDGLLTLLETWTQGQGCSPDSV